MRRSILLLFFASVVISLGACKNAPVQEKAALNNKQTLDTAGNFGYKIIWFTVSTNDKKKLADALGLSNQQASGWENGITQAYADKVFITPAIGQWTMAIGWGLLCPGLKDPHDDLKCLKDKINRLSTIFGEAQLFVTYRVNEYHLWAKSINGKLIRLYFYIGATGENIDVEGTPTPVEEKLRLVNTLSPEAKRDSNYLDRTDLTTPGEDVVMKIAGNWSIDPSHITERKDISAGMGLLGEG